MSVVKLENVGYSIEIQSHKKEYTKSILSSVDLEVEPGEFHLIKGPSGSGKTTLLQIIATFLHQTQGKRTVFDCHLPQDEAFDVIYSVRSRIGYLFQTPFLPPDMKIQDFIQLQAQLSRLDINSAEKASEELLAEFGMEDFTNSYPIKLSGGEKQRVALAGTLAKKIDLLLLDEPTGSLDRENKDIIWEKILQQKETGLTIIAVTHDESIINLADFVYVLDYGKLSQISL